MKIYLNGQICEEEEAKISVFDHGFLYGMGVFETFRTYHGKPFLLFQHLQRLEKSCHEAGIHCTLDATYIEQSITQLLLANHLSDAYFRYSISAGVAPLGLPGNTYEHPTHILYVKALPTQPSNAMVAHKDLQKLHHTRNSPESTNRLKSFHYMNNILAKFELQSYPWAQQAEGLMLTEQGYLAEGIVSNLFFVVNRELYTPDLRLGILAGITRACILRLAKEQGMEVHEGKYTWNQLLEADEIFLTNSIQGIVPVFRIYDDTKLVKQMLIDSTAGCTNQLMSAYQDLTERAKR
jgi:4-amino-4-deoxychorismate lyase